MSMKRIKSKDLVPNEYYYDIATKGKIRLRFVAFDGDTYWFDSDESKSFYIKSENGLIGFPGVTNWYTYKNK